MSGQGFDYEHRQGNPSGLVTLRCLDLKTPAHVAQRRIHNEASPQQVAAISSQRNELPITKPPMGPNEHESASPAIWHSVGKPGHLSGRQKAPPPRLKSSHPLSPRRILRNMALINGGLETRRQDCRALADSTRRQARVHHPLNPIGHPGTVDRYQWNHTKGR
jgi:hypothetical protein